MARDQKHQKAAGQKAAGQRPLRVGEELRHALAELLARGDLRDPDLADASVTVSEVRVSPDLKNATAFVLPLGGRNSEPVLAGLARSAPYLRGQLARMLRLRFAPALTFKLDDSFDRALQVDALLRRPDVAADLEPRPAPRPPRDGNEDGA